MSDAALFAAGCEHPEHAEVERWQRIETAARLLDFALLIRSYIDSHAESRYVRLVQVAALAVAAAEAASIDRPACDRRTEELDVERLHYALERVDPVAFARDGTAAVTREDIDYFRYAQAIARAYLEGVA